MERIKDYAKGKYKIEFKDKRVEFMDLSPAEIRFLHNKMAQLNIGRWEILEEIPCGLFTNGGDTEYCLKTKKV